MQPITTPGSPDPGAAQQESPDLRCVVVHRFPPDLWITVAEAPRPAAKSNDAHTPSAIARVCRKFLKRLRVKLSSQPQDSPQQPTGHRSTRLQAPELRLLPALRVDADCASASNRNGRDWGVCPESHCSAASPPSRLSVACSGCPPRRQTTGSESHPIMSANFSMRHGPGFAVGFHPCPAARRWRSPAAVSSASCLAFLTKLIRRGGIIGLLAQLVTPGFAIWDSWARVHDAYVVAEVLPRTLARAT